MSTTFGSSDVPFVDMAANQSLLSQRVAEAGLAERIEVRLCDYRDMSGVYDKIVSIEMLEAVGDRYFEAFFAQCERLLAPNGLLALQVITCPDSRYEALRDGDLVAIFPEGRITDTGELYPFRPGITRILDRCQVPVVPLALRGLWGSFFSRVEGRAMSNPSRLRPLRRIALVAGDIVAPEQATPEALQQTVLRLRGDWR